MLTKISMLRNFSYLIEWKKINNINLMKCYRQKNFFLFNKLIRQKDAILYKN